MRRCGTISFVFFLLCGLSLAPTSQGQDIRGWAGAGIGRATVGSIGPSVRVAGHLLLGRLAFAGRISINLGRPEFGPLFDGYYESGLVVGYAPGTNAIGQIVVGGGPALLWGRRIVGEESPPCSGWFGCSVKWEEVGPAPALAMEAGLYGRLFEKLGYSLVLHAI